MGISVAMCTYNGARYLGEQLESIASQTRAPDELVICDDGSSDETVQIIRAFSAQSKFPVRLYVNEKNLGSTKNFEQAIALCNQEIIALADQDDVWRANKLEVIEDVFFNSPQTGLVFSDAELVGEDLQPLGYSMWEKNGFDEGQKNLIKGGHALDVLLPGWTVTGATIAFRAHFRELLLPIPTHLPMIHDGWIAVMISAVAEINFINEPLIKYRQHAGQQIGAPAKRDEDEAAASETDLNPIKAGMSRVNSYSDSLDVLKTIHQRLRANIKYEDAFSGVEGRLKHFTARASLPAGKLKRLPIVTRELFAKRYHLYSKGVYSAAKDLLA